MIFFYELEKNIEHRQNVEEEKKKIKTNNTLLEHSGLIMNVDDRFNCSH